MTERRAGGEESGSSGARGAQAPNDSIPHPFFCYRRSLQAAFPACLPPPAPALGTPGTQCTCSSGRGGRYARVSPGFLLPPLSLLAPSSPQRTRRKRRAQVKAGAGQRLHAQAFGREFGRNAAEHGGAWSWRGRGERQTTKEKGDRVWEQRDANLQPSHSGTRPTLPCLIRGLPAKTDTHWNTHTQNQPHLSLLTKRCTCRRSAPPPRRPSLKLSPSLLQSPLSVAPWPRAPRPRIEPG